MVGTNSLIVEMQKGGYPDVYVGNGKLDPDDNTISDVHGEFYYNGEVSSSSCRSVFDAASSRAYITCMTTEGAKMAVFDVKLA